MEYIMVISLKTGEYLAFQQILALQSLYRMLESRQKRSSLEKYIPNEERVPFRL